MVNHPSAAPSSGVTVRTTRSWAVPLLVTVKATSPSPLSFNETEVPDSLICQLVIAAFLGGY